MAKVDSEDVPPEEPSPPEVKPTDEPAADAPAGPVPPKSPSNAAGPGAGDDDKVENKLLYDKNKYATNSCFCLPKTSPFRQFCFKIAVSQSFDYFILVFILINALMLAITDYTLECVDKENQPSTVCTSNQIVASTERIFTVVFSIEMIVKIIAFGFYSGGSQTYMKDPWSYLDFLVVISSWVGEIMVGLNLDMVNLSVLRIFRVLRPLKSVSKLPKLKRLLSALASSIPNLWSNFIILMFVLILFSILGVQFFIGYGLARCRLTEWPVKYDPNYCIDNGLGSLPPMKGDDGCFNAYISELVQKHQDDPEKYMCRKDADVYNSDYSTNMDISSKYISYNQFETVDTAHVLYIHQDKISSVQNLFDEPMDCFWPTDDADENVCSMEAEHKGTGQHKCYPVPDDEGFLGDQAGAPTHYPDGYAPGDTLISRWCGSNYDPFGKPRFNDDKAPYHYTGSRMISATYLGGLNWGYTTFSHFGAAMLTIGQSVTQEGWVDIMYMYMDSYDPWTALFVFFMLILLGAFLMLNLMLAVITKQIEDTPEDGKVEVIVRKNGEVQKDKKDEALIKSFKIHGVVETDSIFTLKKMIQSNSEEDIPPDQQKITWYPAAKKHGWNGPDVEDGAIILVDSTPNPSGLISGEPIPNTIESYGMPEDAVIYLDIDKELISASTRRKIIQEESQGFKRLIIDFVEAPFFTQFIYVMIFINTIVLALDQHPMDKGMEDLSGTINLILAGVFFIEMSLKLVAFGPSEYVKDNYNIFDAIVVAFSILEEGMALASTAGSCEPEGGAGGGLSALRAFRIFRVFKMAKDWESLQTLLSTMVVSLMEIGNFFLLLCLFVYIFALVGIQAFANKFHFDGDTGWPVEFTNDPDADENNYRVTEIAVCNFDTFVNAVVTIFQVLTGENWNTVMYDARRSVGAPIAYAYFFSLVLLGVFMVMNIFLAILLSNFEGNEDLVAPPPGDGESEGAGKKLLRRTTIAVSFLRDSMRGKSSSAAIIPVEEVAEADELAKAQEAQEVEDSSNGELIVKMLVGGLKSEDDVLLTYNREDTILQVKEKILKITKKRPQSDQNIDNMRLLSTNSVENKKELEDDEPLWKYNIEPTEPIFCEVEESGVLCCLTRKGAVRSFAKYIHTQSWFDNGILTVIVVSSICLACDNPFDQSSGGAIFLKALDIVFLVIFIVEFLVKFLYFGFVANGQLSYLHSSWNILDFIIVVVGIVDLTGQAQLSFLKALRTIRVLRPLRMISRRRELKLVMDALLSSLPSIINVAVVCFLFFLIFAIVGVNMFKGVMSACQGDGFDALTDAQQDLITTPPKKWVDFTDEQMGWIGTCTEAKMDKLVEARFANPDCYTSQDLCQCWLGLDAWDYVVNGLNFDNVGYAMGTLYEISTTEGWVDVMYAGIDGVAPFMQPIRGHNGIAIIYFVIFMLFGAFFVMQLFVGVIIERFNAIREENEAEGKGQAVFATTEQKLMVKTVGFLRSMADELKKKLKPYNPTAFGVIMNDYFDPFIMTCIILNSMFMAITYQGMSDDVTDFLKVANFIFAAIFFVEMCLKLLGLGVFQYFRDTWNIFDFTIVWGTNVGIYLELSGGSSIGSAASVVRMFRIGRILRLFNSWTSLKKVMKVIYSIGPALTNVTAILLLLLMIYAVLGVQLFAYIELNDDLTEHAHFQNPIMSAATLFRYLTGENWNGMMHSMATESDTCIDGEHYAKKETYEEGDMGYMYGDKWETKLCTFNNNENRIDNCIPVNMCGNKPVLLIFFYLYTVMMTMVMLNLFIGIILDAFGETDEQVLTDEQMESFAGTWQEFDEDAKKVIKLNQLVEFMQQLEEPMGFGQDYNATPKELEDMVLGLNMMIRLSRFEVVDKAGSDLGELELEAFDIATAVAKRVAKNKAKLAFAKADIGVRIDVGSKRGTIVGYDGEEGHIIDFDNETTKNDAKLTFFDLNALSCVVHGRVSCTFISSLPPVCGLCIIRSLTRYVVLLHRLSKQRKQVKLLSSLARFLVLPG
jgi:hypothetical protein